MFLMFVNVVNVFKFNDFLCSIVIATLCNFPVAESFFSGGFTHIQMRVVDLLF